jgi:indole-3-glycerol phosphate synthase
LKTILDDILVSVRAELAARQALCPLAELRARAADAPPLRSLEAALLSEGFSLLAEIKERSPSVGPMRKENVLEAAQAYAECPLVKGISVLTNETHFGGSLNRLQDLRQSSLKPLLRKDFIIDPYQIYEARVAGADAILLMANVLDGPAMKELFALATDLQLEVLFEIHTEEELATIPPGARILGINSRKFKTTTGFSGAERAAQTDFSVDLSVFSLVQSLPGHVVKVAESGLSAATIGQVAGIFDAALIGTSLLRDPRGVRAHLADLMNALHHQPAAAATP